MSIDIATITKSAPVINIATRNSAPTETTKNIHALSDHAPPDDKATEVSPEALQSAVKQGNAFFQAEQRDLQINVDDSTKRVVVKVIDRSSGELIRQMPTKEVLDFVKALQQQANGNSGLLIKNSA